MHITKHPLVLAALLSLGLTACPGSQGESESDTDAASTGASESDATTATATAATGDATESSGAAGTDSDSATGGEATSASTSTSTSTTGSTTDDPTTGGASDLQGSCEAACEVVYGCFPGEFTDEAECLANCLEGPMGPEPDAPCEAALIAFNHCIAASTCDELDTEGVCGAEYDGLIGACIGEESCEVAAGGGASACGIVESCTSSERELACEGEECVCLEDGEEVGSCANDVCVDGVGGDALAAKALSCCGFEL